jgi:hypothetical protein
MNQFMERSQVPEGPSPANESASDLLGNSTASKPLSHFFPKIASLRWYFLFLKFGIDFHKIRNRPIYIILARNRNEISTNNDWAASPAAPQGGSHQGGHRFV